MKEIDSEQIIQARIRGESVRSIARRLGCTIDDVNDVLDRVRKGCFLPRLVRHGSAAKMGPNSLSALRIAFSCWDVPSTADTVFFFAAWILASKTASSSNASFCQLCDCFFVTPRSFSFKGSATEGDVYHSPRCPFGRQIVAIAVTMYNY